MSRGADYAWADVAPAALKAAGCAFICRYVSHDLTKVGPLPTAAAIDDPVASQRSRRAFTLGVADAGPPRKTTYGEVAAALASGLGVAIVWEDTANAAAQGYSRGVSDATEADRQVRALGLSQIPIYFAVDYDAPVGDQPAINAYLDGAASVIGRTRVGIYGGYWPLTRARQAGKATWFWGTYAWSGTNWGTCGWTPHLMQQLAMTYIGGVQCDIDIASTADFGQIPRPGGPTVDATIMQGDSGTGVSKAQGRLNVWHASPPVVVDGEFGPATTTAVKAFQGGQHLTVDGVVGPASWTALNKTPAVPVVPGKLPAPAGLGVDRKRLPIGWNPVTGKGLTGYTAVAYGVDGNAYATEVTTAPWCVLNNLAPGGTYTIRVWANGGTVAPDAAEFTITLPT